MRIVKTMVVVIFVTILIVGCTVFKIEEEKLQDLPYAIVKEEDCPEEVQILIADNLVNEMKMSFVDQGIEYIIIGYGEQETSGYSVEVLAVYETANLIKVETNLIGPMNGETIVEVSTYPYIVISIDENQKPVVYE